MKEADKKTSPPYARLFAVAPMIDWTDRHCRFFHRLLSPHAVLYSEMITTGAILHGKRNRLLEFSPSEHPVILQLGGSDPSDLAEAAKIAEDYGYDEINLNCGCPSERVQKGSFGACLMAEPSLVASCVEAMRNTVKIPVSVKCRIGINASVNDSDDYAFLDEFIRTISGTGCTDFTIHARKAWLKGLSPKENREIPPLRYDMAAKIKEGYPHLKISLNGGLKTLDQIDEALKTFDGVMIGREAYQNPWFLALAEQHLYGTPLPDRFTIAQQMVTYIKERQAESGTPVHSVTRHMLGLFNGLRGAKLWRQKLGAEATRATAPDSLIEPVVNQIQRMLTPSLPEPE